MASTAYNCFGINNRGPTLQPTLLSDELGELVQAAYLQFIASSGFEDFAGSSFHTSNPHPYVGKLPHLAATLLKDQHFNGIPIKLTTPPWTLE